MKAIEVQELTKRYGDLVAVDRISFTVEEGEFFGFLGPNGAGKTTTVRMLTGIISPNSGRALVAGRDVTRDPLRVKQVLGVVPEMANVYIDLSVWGNLMLMGELYGVPRRERRARAEVLLRDFGLWERRYHRAKALSKGLRQRLLLAMALIHAPKILFLDEPTSGLDVQSARLIREKLRELHSQGVTIFLTTHNLEEAEQLCQRIAIIEHGRIIAFDSPERLKRTALGLQIVEVRFNRCLASAELAALPGVGQVKRAGDKLRLYTAQPEELIIQLVDLARANGLKIIALNTLGPSLEEVFLELTTEKEGDSRWS